MLELAQTLSARLKDLKVRMDMPDGDTVIFRGVPLDPRYFSKPRTNLLIKRPQEGLPFLIGVDEDLQYIGGDEMLTRAFAGGSPQAGWRVLFQLRRPFNNLQRAVEGALAALGFDGREPTLSFTPEAPNSESNSLLNRSGKPRVFDLGTDLTRRVREGTAEPTVGRDEEIAEVAACLLRWGQARLPFIVGQSGVGKTNLLHGVARKLNECRPSFRVVSLDLANLWAGTLFPAERENLLNALFQQTIAAPETVVALEHLEWVHRETPHGLSLQTNALDAGGRIIGTVLPDYVPALQHACIPLTRRLHVVALKETDVEETLRILTALRDRLSAHHAVDIDDSCLRLCVHAAQRLPGCFPAKALALLDAAAARAAFSTATVVGADDVDEAMRRRLRAQTWMEEEGLPSRER